jgi:hypothetical protein
MGPAGGANLIACFINPEIEFRIIDFRLFADSALMKKGDLSGLREGRASLSDLREVDAIPH